MARTPYSLNSYVGGAIAATIAGSGWGAADTTVSITGTNSIWNTLGNTGGFYFAAAYGTATEEKIYVPSGNWFANNGATFIGVTRGIDQTTAVAQASGLLCTPVITSIDTSEANELVYQNFGNFIVRSGTGTCNPGEWTVFSGTLAAQTLSLPSGVINQTDNQISNYSTVAVTIASGSNAQLDNYGVLGNVTIPPQGSYTFTYETGNTTWYVMAANSPTAYVGSGIAGQHLTPSGTIPGGLAWSQPFAYAMPPIYLSPYKAWTHDPNIATATQTLITGTLYYHSIWIPESIVVSGISFYSSTFAATDVAYVGLFSATNNQQVAVCSGFKGGTTGLNTALISGGTYNISEPGLYYVGIVFSGSSSPVVYGPVAGQPALVNMNIGTQTNVLTGLRTASVIIGQRALYANGTTVSGSIAGTTLTPWFALS